MKLRNWFEVTAIPKKTTAKLFENVEVGDILYMEYELESSVGYVPYMLVVNQTKDERINAQLNQTAVNLRKFELKEVGIENV